LCLKSFVSYCKDDEFHGLKNLPVLRPDFL
jgi:hypothetical protein